MRSVVLALVAIFVMAMPVSAKTATTTITASPGVAAVGDTVYLEWSGIPTKGRTVNLVVETPCYGGTEVLNMYVNSTWQFIVTCPGTNVFEVVQGDKILASDSVEVQ